MQDMLQELFDFVEDKREDGTQDAVQGLPDNDINDGDDPNVLDPSVTSTCAAVISMLDLLDAKPYFSVA